MLLLNTLRRIGLIAVAIIASHVTAAENDTVRVLMSTSAGDITLELNHAQAPITVENFIAYVNSQYYNGTVFHRVIRDFMIQGGGMDMNMRPKSTQIPIKNEADNGLDNKRGTIAMARTSNINSATSQFFINVKDNDFLNHGGRDFGYAVFGKVIEGMDVVDAISLMKTNSRDEPLVPVVIRTVTVLEQAEPAPELEQAI